MNYPDDFYTPTFPAGKTLAVSRAMGIGIMSVFVLIIFLCGLLIWTVRSMRVEPYILATNGFNDQWRVIYTQSQTAELNPNQVLQESVVWQFTRNWLTISPDHVENALIWNTECKHEDCLATETIGNRCALFCASDEALFHRFEKDVLPMYEAYQSAGETWIPEPKSLRIEPIGAITNDGGSWWIKLTVLTYGGNNPADIKAMDIVAYATTKRNTVYFPATFGYYVYNFNAYRVSQ